MTAIKVIQMTPGDRLTDEYGGIFPNAVVVLNKVVIDSKSELDANYDSMKYTDDGGSISGMAYNVSYWYEKKFMPQANATNPNEKEPRKMPNKEGGFAFSVNPDIYESIYNSANGDHYDKCLAVCERHFRNEVLPTFRD